jgi:hypothetical protein
LGKAEDIGLDIGLNFGVGGWASEQNLTVFAASYWDHLGFVSAGWVAFNPKKKLGAAAFGRRFCPLGPSPW